MTLLRSLHGKLSLALLALLCVLAAFFVLVTARVLSAHEREVRQRTYADLAASVAGSSLLMLDGELDGAALMAVFKELEALNPSVDAYLLDPAGRVLASAREARPAQVAIGPVAQFLAGAPLPLYGDNPARPGERVIFSVAALPSTGPAQAYLYLVLQNDAEQSLSEMMRGSLVARLVVWTVLGSLLVALAVGVLLFLSLTRRLRRLTAQVERYDPSQGGLALTSPASADEVGRLSSVFVRLAQTIEGQLQALQAADRERRELITNVSHDLRTPLTSLQGYLETLQMRAERLTEGERDAYLHTALRQSERLGLLIRELFELTKLESLHMRLEPERFSLAELAQDTIQKFRLRAEAAGVALGYETQGRAEVRGDVALLERALSNLLDNAIRHTPRGGQVLLVLREDGNRVRVTLSDSGGGIPPEDLPHIFERYYRAERTQGGVASEGTGLGLAIAKRILELHGSAFEVESSPGRGAAFSFELPG